MQFMFFATAASESGDSDLFSALGIDWLTLLSQVAAFLLLVFLFGKFVYPVLVKTIDKRQADIDNSLKAADKARKEAEASEANIEKMLKKARVDADDILETAKIEAANNQTAAEAKAKKRAEQILADAQIEIQKEVESAKALLHNETLELVALATEKVVGKTLTGKIDETIITDAIKAVK